MRKGRSTLYDLVVDYNIEGPAFSWRRLDEGPRLNVLGKLMMLLHFLEVKSADQVFLGNTVRPRFEDRL